MHIAFLARSFFAPATRCSAPALAGTTPNCASLAYKNGKVGHCLCWQTSVSASAAGCMHRSNFCTPTPHPPCHTTGKFSRSGHYLSIGHQKDVVRPSAGRWARRSLGTGTAGTINIHEHICMGTGFHCTAPSGGPLSSIDDWIRHCSKSSIGSSLQPVRAQGIF